MQKFIHHGMKITDLPSTVLQGSRKLRGRFTHAIGITRYPSITSPTFLLVAKVRPLKVRALIVTLLESKNLGFWSLMARSSMVRPWWRVINILEQANWLRILRIRRVRAFRASILKSMNWKSMWPQSLQTPRWIYLHHLRAWWGHLVKIIATCFFTLIDLVDL